MRERDGYRKRRRKEESERENEREKLFISVNRC